MTTAARPERGDTTVPEVGIPLDRRVGRLRQKRAGLRGPMPVRCEICQWRGLRLTPRRAPCPACGSRVEFV